MGSSICIQEVHGRVFISGRLTVVFQGTGGEAMGWRSQPPPPTSCQVNKAPKSSLPLPLLPSPPYPRPPLKPIAVSRPKLCGCGGFSCQQGYLTAKKEKQKQHVAGLGERMGNKGITSLKTKGILSQQEQ